MLTGKRILVVKDEPIVAMAIEDMLDDLGAHIVGPAASVAEAFDALSAHPVDAAILDINLGTERSNSIADHLRQLGTPFIFATGYGRTDSANCGDEPVVEKPYRVEAIATALSEVMSQGRLVTPV